MKVKKETIEPLIERIDALIKKCKAFENRYAAELKAVHPDFKKSAINLVHYRALRSEDLRDLQKNLGELGVSRLAKAESHVLASLYTTRSILRAMIEPRTIEFKKAPLSIKKGEKLLSRHSRALFGRRTKGRRVRIMVTLPSEAADDFPLVLGLVASGMDCARINCAHDDTVAWERMIKNVRRANRKLKRNVRICMDLGGPKIRTGSMRPGPKVASFSPERDNLGFVISPAVVWLAPPEFEPPLDDVVHLPVRAEWLERLAPATVIDFEDTRGKHRELHVVRREGDGVWASCYDRSFVVTGTLLTVRDADLEPEPVGDLLPVEESILLKTGDTLLLHRSDRPGEPARYDADGLRLEPAHISCTNEALFNQVKPGERILFDDGKIVGRIDEVRNDDEMVITVTYTREGGQKLRADKGINLPDSRLDIRGLTPKDREDLAFIVRKADIVNLSFVNTPEDARDLIAAIEALRPEKQPGVILKIETQSGFDRLTEILLAGMQVYPIGIMIARGDLAIETGWEHMAHIQEEMLSLCMAGHVPDIWATQVLENLAKKGLPSRAEVTDAAMSQRAECVMLNKGPYILQAIGMLDHILESMKDYQTKKAPMLPRLDVPEPAD